MSHQTITQATRDPELADRITAAIAKESWGNEAYGATDTGQSVRVNGPEGATHYFLWPVAIDYEAEYEYAVDADNPSPGGDPGVITDEMISSAVQVHWPDPPPPPPPPPDPEPLEE